MRKKAEGKDKATKSVGQDSKKAKGIVPKETVKGSAKPKDGGSKDLGKSKSKAKPKAGGPEDGGSPASEGRLARHIA